MADGANLRTGGLPAPDPARVEALRAALDPASPENFAEGERKAVVDLLDRVVSDVRTGDLTEARARLTHLDAALARLDVGALEPRRGLAGLFDGRGKRLRAFRETFAEVGRGLTDTASDLAERAGAVARRDAALETLWADLRQALEALNAHLAAASAVLSPAPTGDEADPHAPLRARTRDLIACRDAALAALPRLRSAQNADAPALSALERCTVAVEAWKTEWTDALGLAGRRPKKVRPDAVRLDKARQALADASTQAAARLDASLKRRTAVTTELQDLRRTF